MVRGVGSFGVLRERLADGRGGRVVFVSHCLLNQNARYLGGATRPGMVDELVRLFDEYGLGIVQLPCPEERAWGGILKPRLLRACGARQRRWFRYRRPLLWFGLAWTRHVYRPMARRVVRQMCDYHRAGIEVVALVGVGASPSCGVLSTLDLRGALDALADVNPAEVERRAFNRDVISAHAIAGQGVFVHELSRGIARHGLDVLFVEHDLLTELAGRPSSAVSELSNRLASGPRGQHPLDPPPPASSAIRS